MSLRTMAGFVCALLTAQASAQLHKGGETDADLRARIEASPTLAFHGVHFAAKATASGWESGTISWVAVDPNGTIYEVQRGDKADPVLALDGEGNVVRSWGKGNYKIPHSVRIDPAGDIWTVDAGSSTVIKYSPSGKKIMSFTVGEQPENGSSFNGTTDVAFAPHGRILVTDGYANARVLEYTSDGKRVKQWGKPGADSGELNLPHAIQIDKRGVVYVADRENGRIEKFDIDGNYIGEISHLGRVFAVKVTADALWATIQTHGQPVTSGGWIVKLDRTTGRIVGHLEIPEFGGHSIEVTPSGEPITTLGNELLWFKAN